MSQRWKTQRRSRKFVAPFELHADRAYCYSEENSYKEENSMVALTLESEPALRASPEVHQTKMLIDGKWVDAMSGKTFETINPATEECHRRSRRGRQGRRRPAPWRPRARRSRTARGAKMDARERGRLIYKLADLIEEDIDELAALETLDNGKPIRDAATADLPLVIDCYRYYAGWADKIDGQTIPVERPLLHATRGTSRSASSGRSSRGTSRC